MCLCVCVCVVQTVSDLSGTTKPFTTLQQAVNRNMIASLAVPEFRVGYEICTDKLDALYAKLKPKVRARGSTQADQGSTLSCCPPSSCAASH